MSDLRQLIREVLVQELGKMPDPPNPPRQTDRQITQERVTIRTNADLAAFVQRLMAVAQDGRLRADIEAGRHVFHLAEGPPPALAAHQPGAPSPARPDPIRFERGLVSERDVASLPRGAARIEVGNTVRFTPLARDELRRRGIKIERAPG